MIRYQTRLAPNDAQKVTDAATLGTRLLVYGSYAPSVHNCQPWLVTVESPTAFLLHANAARVVPQADPTGRGLHMALGAFIENVRQAGEALGQTVDVTLLPSHQPQAVARVSWRPAHTAPSPAEAAATLESITTRRTHRGPFSPLPDPVAAAARLTEPPQAPAAVHFHRTPEAIAALAAAVRDGTRLAYQDRAFCQEHAQWLRTSFTRRDDGIPGYAIGVTPWLSLIVPSVIKKKDISKNRSEQEYAKALHANLCASVHAPDSPEGWLAAGITLERLLLRATRLGIAQAPNAAAVEMGHLRADLDRLSPGAEPTQLIVRFGEAKPLTHTTPRRPVSAFTTGSFGSAGSSGALT